VRPTTDASAGFNGRFQALFSSKILRTKKKWCSVGLALVCISSLLITPGCRRDKGKLIFALPVADWWTAAPFLIPESGEMFKRRDLELVTLEVKSGLESKNAVVAGTADIGLSAATPLALAAARNEGLVILGTYLRATSIVGLVRPSALAANVVPPAPVGIVPSTISQSFLYYYLKQNGQEKQLLDRQLQTFTAKPADIPGLFNSNSIKSAVIWEPFLSIAGEQPGLIADRNTPFEVNLYIITRPSVLKDRPKAIEAFLGALDEACGFLRDNSNQSRQNMEKRFGFRPDFLAASWPKVQYQVLNERQRMEAEINRESETAKALGQITEVPKLDYLFSH
jgi:ABC-type nitrate/sulfonate/bicarbonate transport system substrate-binding protein